MACRTHQLNKNTGITYVYESSSYWDPIKKQPRNKKVYIGKLSKDTKNSNQSTIEYYY